MGNYQELKDSISAVITNNGNNEITGEILQNVLLSIVSIVGDNSTFKGIATPSTNPGTPDQNIFYIATRPGRYVNFNQVNITGLAVLTNKTGNWSAEHLGLFDTHMFIETSYNGSDDNIIINANGSVTVKYQGFVVIVNGRGMGIANTYNGVNLTITPTDAARYFVYLDITKAYDGDLTRFDNVFIYGTSRRNDLPLFCSFYYGVLQPQGLIAPLYSKWRGKYAFGSLLDANNEKSRNIYFNRNEKGDNVIVEWQGFTFVYGDKAYSVSDYSSSPRKSKIFDGGSVTRRYVYINMPNYGNTQAISVIDDAFLVQDNTVRDDLPLFCAFYDNRLLPTGLIAPLVGVFRTMNNWAMLEDCYNSSYGNISKNAQGQIVIKPQGFRIQQERSIYGISNMANNVDYVISPNSNKGRQHVYINVYAFSEGSNNVSSMDDIFITTDSDMTQEYRHDLPLFCSFYYGVLQPQGLIAPLYATLSQASIDNQQLIFAREDNVVEYSDITDKSREFSALFNNTHNVDSFLFFSDPHLAYSDNLFPDSAKESMSRYLGVVDDYFSHLPLNICVCGGDWLQDDDTQATALYKLSYIYGVTQKLWGNKYVGVIGNHDTNYQGKLNEDSEVNTGQLTNATLANVWYPQEGRAYFIKDTRLTRYFILDTGTDWAATMDDYKWRQIDWLATLLLDNEKEHLAIFMHAIYTSGSNIAPFTQNVCDLCNAFNNKSSISLNGKTYNFANGASGKVYFIMAGHTHADINVEISNIPCIITDELRANNVPTFDLVLVDYDANILSLIRVGTGNNRTINI